MAKTGRRRGLKSILVEPYKQVKIGLIFIVINFIFSGLILAVFGYYVFSMYQAVSIYFDLSDKENMLTLSKFAWPIGVGLTLIVLFVVTTLFLSIRYTHTIYGPLVSIHRFLEELMSDEQPKPIKLRESDQLQDLAEKLNRLGDRFASDRRTGPIVSIHRFLDEALEGKRPAPITLRDGDPHQELAQKLNSLVERIGS